MHTYSIADAKAHFSELIAQAEAGEEVIITRRGTPVARIQSVRPPRKPMPIAELEASLAVQEVAATPSIERLQALRDEARY
jgi:prevent-host-death family protein